MMNFICTVCPRGCHLKVDEKNDYKVTGNRCPRGLLYGYAEATAPTRVLTSTVVLTGASLRRLPVKTDKAIPKEKLLEAMAEVKKLKVAVPVQVGQVLISKLVGTEANLVASRSVSK